VGSREWGVGDKDLIRQNAYSMIQTTMYTYTVSDVANILGMTPGALHFFERENLIDPGKDIHGHRVYNVGDIFRLLSYVKYRLMGSSLKTIAKQIDRNADENNKQLIFQRLQQYRTEAQQKAEYFNQLVSTIDQHISSISRIDKLLNAYEFIQSPAVKFCYTDECGWISKDRRSQTQVRKWIKAQPSVRLGLIMHSQKPPQASFGYTVAPEHYENLALPKNSNLNLREFPSLSCLHTIVTIGEKFEENPYTVFEKSLQYAHSRGFEIAGIPWGHILMVDVDAKAKFRVYVELWIPIN